MKITSRMSALVVCLNFLLVWASASNRQKPQWKGTIDTENGIKVVKNPAEPLFGEFAFELEEDLAIGGDPTKENAYFPRGGGLSVDSEGNLYVADSGNARVQMFDKTGKFVRQLGRRGQGPGEYSFPSRVLFDPDGNPCVWAGSEIICFGKDGYFKKKIQFKTFLNASVFGTKGTIIGTTQPGRGPDGPKYTLIQLDAEGAPLRTIAEYRGEFKKSQTAIIIHAYSNRIAFESLTTDSFVYGFSQDYRLHIADGEGKTLLAITCEEKPISITGKEKAETKKNGVYAWIGTNDKTLNDDGFPDYRPYFRRIFTDDTGRIYIARTGSILEKDAPARIDVFSKDGYFLYKMSWRTFPSVIQAGYFYQVREDKETNEYQIVRFRIKNWERMKKGME
ncbi:MAG: 6-bladed beta-propeller [Candidatus Aminicenantes bacterium]|nr:6-bladed beta-propeller [Candidatus Aminicenantes bacterium]